MPADTRHEGPRANGMPEMYFATAIIAADPALSHTTAVVTDGRFSGAAKGPAVGHVTPEAQDGGPIALIEDGDLIAIHVPDRRLGLVGVHGQRLTTDQVAQLLAERLARWVAPPPRHTSGILSLYARVARGADSGVSAVPPGNRPVGKSIPRTSATCWCDLPRTLYVLWAGCLSSSLSSRVWCQASGVSGVQAFSDKLPHLN